MIIEFLPGWQSVIIRSSPTGGFQQLSSCLVYIISPRGEHPNMFPAKDIGCHSVACLKEEKGLISHFKLSRSGQPYRAGAYHGHRK
jgi:hypothetical protein